MGEAEAEAELEGVCEMRCFDREGVGVGLSLAMGMAVVTERKVVRPAKRVVKCIIRVFEVVGFLGLCRVYSGAIPRMARLGLSGMKVRTGRVGKKSVSWSVGK